MNKKKSHLSVFIIHAVVRWQRHWENIWHQIYLQKVIRPEQTKPQINQDAVCIMKEIYGIDMEANGQHSKLITDIPDADIAISMDAMWMSFYWKGV